MSLTTLSWSLGGAVAPSAPRWLRHWFQRVSKCLIVLQWLQWPTVPEINTCTRQNSTPDSEYPFTPPFSSLFCPAFLLSLLPLRFPKTTWKIWGAPQLFVHLFYEKKGGSKKLTSTNDTKLKLKTKTTRCRALKNDSKHRKKTR